MPDLYRNLYNPEIGELILHRFRVHNFAHLLFRRFVYFQNKLSAGVSSFEFFRLTPLGGTLRYSPFTNLRLGGGLITVVEGEDWGLEADMIRGNFSTDR